MRELPILATDAVALAIMEGRQTQHRVPVKPQPSTHSRSKSEGAVTRADLMAALSRGR